MVNLTVYNNDIMVVSSRVVAKDFGKRHANVLRDIENLISENSILSSQNYFIKSDYKTNGNNKTYKEYLLTKDGFSLLVMGFTGAKALQWKLKYIEAFNSMQQALHDIQFRIGDKKHQLECMSLLQGLLPEELKHERISYIKANTVIDKCVSNIYGFPKMIKKGDMNSEMLKTREKVLDDYLKLFEVLEDNSQVKNALYNKYSHMKLN